MHSERKPPKRQAKKKSNANVLPYCAVPKGLLRDPELIPTDKVVAALILPWLKKKPSGYVLNSVLARQANLDARSVPRSINRLEATGWFQVDRGPAHEGRRRITALWRTSDGLKAILERLVRLGVDVGDDTHVMERMTPMSWRG
jgi:hypothetical protein